MVPVSGTPLLHKLVAQFGAAGVRAITVVRGYAAEKVHAPNVEFVENEDFEGTGELLSLHQARDRIDGDAIISFGDILFRQHILNNLLADKLDIVIAVDAMWERRRKREARHASVEDPGVRTQDGSRLVAWNPRDSEARLPHLLVRRNVSIRWKLLPVHGFPDETREENLIGRRDRFGLDLRFPSQSVLNVEFRRGLPTVLDEHGGLGLRDFLRPSLLDGVSVRSRLLEIKKDRAGDARAAGTYTAARRRPVRAFDEVRILEIAEEAVGRIEDVAAVRESEERLDGVDAVVFDSRFERVGAAQQSHVVVELQARVVILDRDEERLAETVAAGEVERGVGKRPVLPGDQRSIVGTRAILAGGLESELVEEVVRERADQRSRHGVR